MSADHKQPAVPLCLPDIGEAERQAVLEVLGSGWLAHGPYNKRFEADFAARLGVRHAVTMNSCTAALHLAVAASGIDGEVIVPSFTFVASANAVVTAGATPVFADIDPRTFTLDPASVARAITPRTRALMVVHYAGQMADMTALAALAAEHKLLLIEDSAETIGGTWEGKPTGAFGVGCFSFFPTKNITTGEGGMLTTDDDALAARVRALVGHGITSTTYEREEKELPWFRSATYAGYNFRMSNILAAVGYHQLRRLDAMNAARRRLAAVYDRELSAIPGLTVPYVDPRAHHVYQMYVVLLEKAERRNALVKSLNERGIGASVHFFPPAHEQICYRGRGPFRLPVTEDVSRRCVTLPIFPTMTDAQQSLVIDALRELLA